MAAGRPLANRFLALAAALALVVGQAASARGVRNLTPAWPTLGPRSLGPAIASPIITAPQVDAYLAATGLHLYLLTLTRRTDDRQGTAHALAFSPRPPEPPKPGSRWGVDPFPGSSAAGRRGRSSAGIRGP